MRTCILLHYWASGCVSQRFMDSSAIHEHWRVSYLLGSLYSMNTNKSSSSSSSSSTHCTIAHTWECICTFAQSTGILLLLRVCMHIHEHCRATYQRMAQSTLSTNIGKYLLLATGERAYVRASCPREEARDVRKQFHKSWHNAMRASHI